jgi:ABC-2 type transport system permease protein
MLSKIAAFEIRYQLRSRLFLVSFLLFFFMALGLTHIFKMSFSGASLNINSPHNILMIVSFLNLTGLFVFTAFAANLVIRDGETRFAPILFSTPITKLDYLGGRFSGALLVILLIMLSVPLGIFAGLWMPSVDQQKLGPFVTSHYLFAYFLISFPTILALTAGLFCVATLTRSMMWAHVVSMALLVVYFISVMQFRDPTLRTLTGLIDPFGIGAANQVTQYWTVLERNTMLPPLTGVLLYNRLICLGVALLSLVITYTFFKFEAKNNEPNADNNSIPPVYNKSPPLIPKSFVIFTTNKSAVWQQFLARIRSDLDFVFNDSAYSVLLIICATLTVAVLKKTIAVGGTSYFPVTRNVVENVEISFVLIMAAIATYYAGELVWRDRENRMHELIDATMISDWALIAPKVATVILVLIIPLFLTVLIAILFQLFHGYTGINFSDYFFWFMVPWFIDSVLLAVLAVAVQSLVSQKFFGWLLMVIYLVNGSVLEYFGLEHLLYQFGIIPSAALSDMNGMGRFWIRRSWLELYWLAFTAMLFIATCLLWRRGAETRFHSRIVGLRKKLTGSVRIIFFTTAILWVCSGAFIFYNTNILNEYRTESEQELLQADYEKALLAFETIPQPRITDVKLEIEIFPKETRVIANGQYLIENKSGEIQPHIHMRWRSPLKMQTLNIEGATLVQDYKKFDYRIYQFTQPLQPGEKRQIHFSTLLEERGFPNGATLKTIVDNGTFLESATITPSIGMDRKGLLSDPTKRRKSGLRSDLGIAELDDPLASSNNYLRSDSDWINATISVTTDADQTPIAPGYTVSDNTLGNRRTIVNRTESPIMHFFSIQSARYAEKHDVWKDKKGNAIDLVVYYHPPHDHNVSRMLEVMKISLDQFSEKFSPYQFRQARIIEFPDYAGYAQSFANTVPYSEGIGFIQNFDPAKDDEKIDLVTEVTAHEISHQWWAHQIIGANKQGMTMLSESFAEYSSMLVMEKLYGKEHTRKFLKSALDVYLSARGKEKNQEQPLARVENQQYIHYQKGALVMYWLKEVVGEATVNRALRKLLAEFAFKSAPYPSTTDFLRLLRVEAGPQHEQLITDLFEKITLYDMKATDAKAKKLSDGKYAVSFVVEGKKLYAAGDGKETESTLDESFDVGAFTAEPGKKGYTRDSVLLMERRQMKSGKQTITLVVNTLPKLVGIDPYNKRIDRNSDDNFATVTLE